MLLLGSVSPLPRHLLVLSMTLSPTPLADFISEQQVDAALVRTPASAPTDTVAESAASLGLSDASRIVKSIVFVAGNGIPLLVLAPGTLRIDKAALELHMGCRVRLATPAEAEAATGHVVGTIPPLCVDACSTLEVLMDRAVYAQTDNIYAGTGVPSLHLCIPPAELLRLSDATIGDFTLTSPPEVSAPLSPPPSLLPILEEMSFEDLLVPGSSADEIGSDERPGGPDAPPLPVEVARVLAAKGLSPTPIELPRAEVLRVRRQAKELVFATLRILPDAAPRAIVPRSSGDADWQQSGDVAPDDGCWYGKDGMGGSGDAIDWKARLEETASAGRSPSPLPAVLSADAWQLIVGKTLHGRLGSEAARELTRQLKPGAIISATGRAQLNPRLTGPDLVARSLRIIKPASPETASPKTVIAPLLPSAAQPPLMPLAPSSTGTGTTFAAVPTPPCVLVDDATSLEQLSAGMDATIITSQPIGVDAEWRPRQFSRYEDEPKPEIPLALLQIATATQTFVIDMVAVSLDQNLALSLLSIMSRVMRAPTVFKFGFAMQEDLRRVEAALPGVTEGAEAIFDLQNGATRALGSPKQSVVGLGAACENLLSIVVDKTEQTSDWSSRPLTAAQLAYAATDASVLLPLANALGRDSWTSMQLGSSQVARQPRRPQITDEEKDRRKAAGLALREQRRAAAPTPPPPPPTISTRALPLAGLNTLLSDYLGPPLGPRSKVQFCAGPRALEDTQTELAAAGGGGLTLWSDGAACLFINTANSQRRGSYSNVFWREHRGELAGSLCFSWYLGRGQRLTDPSIRSLLNPDKPTLLFCRRQPSRPYRCCGRLTAVALAHPEGDERAEFGDGEPTARLPVWETTPPTATHLIWRLDDADALLSSSASKDLGRIVPLSEKGMVEELFGAAGIGSMTPEQYSQSPA